MGIAESQTRWIELNMPRTRRAIADLPNLKGVRLAMSMHLDAKMLPFVRGLVDHGAKLFITTCNPSTVRNDVVATMQDFGAEVFADRDMPADELSRAIDSAIAWGPTHLCEMGADLTCRILSSNNPATKKFAPGSRRRGPGSAGCKARGPIGRSSTGMTSPSKKGCTTATWLD